MSVNAETLRRLAALKLPPDAMSEVLSIIADCTAANDARKERDRIRKRNVRGMSAECPVEKQGQSEPEKSSREEYNTTRAQTVIPVGISNDIPPIVNPHLPTVDAPPKSKFPSPKEILSEVLSEKTAADVVAHRKALRKPLTPRAAELLAKTLAGSGDAERAAATMIERGWQGYRADWDVARPNARAGPARGGNGFAALAVELARNEREQHQQTRRDFEVVPLLPGGVEEPRPRAGGDDDHGLCRDSLDLLVGNGFRRM